HIAGGGSHRAQRRRPQRTGADSGRPAGMEQHEGATVFRIPWIRAARVGQGAEGLDHALLRGAGGKGRAMSTLVLAPEPVEAKPGMGRAFWSVMIAFLVHGLVVSTWVSRIAAMKTALRLSDGALGLALLGAAIGSVTAIPICGALVTR